MRLMICLRTDRNPHQLGIEKSGIDNRHDRDHVVIPDRIDQAVGQQDRLVAQRIAQLLVHLLLLQRGHGEAADKCRHQ